MQNHTSKITKAIPLSSEETVSNTDFVSQKVIEDCATCDVTYHFSPTTAVPTSRRWTQQTHADVN